MPSSSAMARSARWSSRWSAIRAMAAGVHLLAAVPPEDLLPWVASADVGVMPIQPSTRNHRTVDAEQAVRGPRSRRAGRRQRLPGDAPDRHGRPHGPLGAVCRPDDPPDVARAIASIARAAARRAGGAAARAACRPPTNAGTGRPRSPACSACMPTWDAFVTEAGIVPQRCVLVLPSTAEFDSRTYRIASTLSRRGHDVTVMARLGPGLAPTEDHPAGYRIRPGAGFDRGRPAGPDPPAGRLRTSAATDRRGGPGPGRGGRPCPPVGRDRPVAGDRPQRARATPGDPPGRAAGRPVPRHGLHGHPGRARPRPPGRRTGRLRRPRHLRRRGQPGAAAPTSPTPVGAGSNAAGRGGRLE